MSLTFKMDAKTANPLRDIICISGIPKVCHNILVVVGTKTKKSIKLTFYSAHSQLTNQITCNWDPELHKHVAHHCRALDEQVVTMPKALMSYFHIYILHYNCIKYYAFAYTIIL